MRISQPFNVWLAPQDSGNDLPVDHHSAHALVGLAPVLDSVVVSDVPCRPLTEEIDELGRGEFAGFEQGQKRFYRGRHAIDEFVNPVRLNEIAMFKRRTLQASFPVAYFRRASPNGPRSTAR